MDVQFNMQHGTCARRRLTGAACSCRLNRRTTHRANASFGTGGRHSMPLGGRGMRGSSSCCLCTVPTRMRRIRQGALVLAGPFECPPIALKSLLPPPLPSTGFHKAHRCPRTLCVEGWTLCYCATASCCGFLTQVHAAPLGRGRGACARRRDAHPWRRQHKCAEPLWVRWWAA
jgi:hypothetical protein